MNEYTKPTPRPTFWSRAFWEGCKQRKLLIQQCNNCKHYIFYPKLFCPYCLGPDLKWVKASGNGKVYTYTIVQSYQPTVFAKDVPYVIAVIELDEGVRMMSNIVGCQPEAVKCEMKVEVVFEDITDDFTLPKFRPAARTHDV